MMTNRVDISVEQKNKYTNTWKVSYGTGKVFERDISSDFPPEIQKKDWALQDKVLESNFSLSEKVIFCYMQQHEIFGTGVCYYLASTIAKKLNMSYSTVRKALKNMVTAGLLEIGEILTDGNNMGKQYRINYGFTFSAEDIDDIHAGEDDDPTAVSPFSGGELVPEWDPVTGEVIGWRARTTAEIY